MLSSTLLCLVIGITDGDTIKVRCGDPGAYQQLTVRLAAIDAPERSQPFGTASRQHLSALCFNQRASLRARTHDRYGRVVADVTCAGTDAGAAMVSSGMAWVYERYVHPAHDAELFTVQAKARASGVGLWREADPVPPWMWRKSGKKSTLIRTPHL